MKIGRNKKYLLLLLGILVLTFMLAACGDKKNSGDSPIGNIQGATDSGNAVVLSRADYIGLVGQTFGFDNYEAVENFYSDVSSDNAYYKNIQACAEWNVIPASGNFEPDKDASLEFALATAVKAIGLEDLGLDAGASDKSLAEYYVTNIAQLDTADLNKGISQNTGYLILQYAMEFDGDLVLPQRIDVEFVQGVKEADSKITIPISGNTGTLKEGHGYSVGDIVYFEDTPSGYPAGVKITSISGNQYTFEEASVEEVFSKLNISGTFDGEIINAVAASDNVSFDGEQIYYPQGKPGTSILSPTASGIKSDIGKDHAIFSFSLSDGKGSADFKFGVENIDVTVDYKHEGINVLNPKELKLSVKYDTVIDARADYHSSKTVPLGYIDLKIWGPLCVRLSLTANIGVDGSMQLNYTVHNYASLNWQKGNGVSKSFSSKTSSTFHGEITLTAEATAMADLMIKFWGTHSLANVQITSGVVVIAKADADLLGNQPTCTDVFGYVPLRWGVNQKGCLVTDINKDWRYEGVIWDSKSSKITFHFHWEDGKRTEGDKCTRGEGKEVAQETEKADGKPLDEYEIFDFEPLEFDFIELKEYITFINPNEVYVISFDSIPEGYSAESLKYTVADPTICSVSGGTITALKSGSTLIKISTDDGMFSCTFAVIVNADYSIDGFQEL
ncbi:MAG: hypothetical protein K5678_09765 [Acetatifactor sp.]|nr:hypothetical protein [Acetatifactor sp.]